MKIDSPEVLAPEALTSENAETTVISILLGYGNAIDSIGELRAEHFYHENLRAVFAELVKQIRDGRGVSVVSLHEALKDAVTLEDLHNIAQWQSIGGNSISRLSQQIIDLSRARQLYSAADRISGLAFDHGPVGDRIDKAQAVLASLADHESDADWVDAYSAALEHTALLERRADGELKGIPTGLQDVDEMLDGGMQRGNLVIVGARPSHGKTAMALTMALNTSVRHSTAFLSMEMSISEIMDRQAASLGHVSLSFIKRPEKGLDFSKVLEAVELAKQRKLFLLDRGGMNILQVKRYARRLKRTKGLEVLVVDYIGLMAGLDAKQPRAYQIEEISRGLKELAKELDIAVICLAQLNRAGADRSKKRPQLTDLRDSGAIEQDADVVMFIHRPEMDDPNCDARFKHYGLLFIAKNRQGRCGDVHLYYEGEQTRFTAWGGPVPTETVAQTTNAKGFSNGK